VLVAIHQPNYLPWLGYFDKLARCERFIFLDDADYVKGSWINRVRVSGAASPHWLSVPVLTRHRTGQPIKEVEINSKENWRHKHLQTLRSCYGGSPGFNHYFPGLAAILESPWERLADLNIALVHALARWMGIPNPESRTVRSSELGVGGKATERLVNLVCAAGGSRYLCGGGAGGYQEDAAFAAAGLELTYQDFRHPEYPRGGRPFIPGLSSMDWLFWTGGGKYE